ncbi:hypothetical protein HYFRA_00005825 [Hymenoscyphus fraxineus]|uniref:Ubiquitin carboxyl-terminal hydrolase n=1 Tax=Hymenoscyphus fraxineus TaxID=746836 RepID=A0A9N9KTY6_9HELO|nr:hypothetical protein HYFRA_00005825 [Hymenoscyphus fraxineus]
MSADTVMMDNLLVGEEVGGDIASPRCFSPHSMGRSSKDQPFSSTRALSEGYDSARDSMSPRKRTVPVVETQTPVKRPQRKRKTVTYNEEHNDASVAEGMRPLTFEERQEWKGWVELESDPMIFNYILREYGVKDVKIQEVFSLDDMELAALPQPVYGLIFLFRYRDEDEDENSDEKRKCPRHVWFANQTTNNACATVALMNIVMNAPEIELGEVLTEFKNETKQLKPAYRGKALSENIFIRTIHNSFARRMDVLNADLWIENEFEKWEKSSKTPKRKKTSKAPPTRRKKKTNNEDLAYHFIAFVPIKDEVWRFDGLQRQPLNLGKANSNWLSVARECMQMHIAQHEEDGVQFNLLSLCKSPVSSLPSQIATSMQAVIACEERLNAVEGNWRISASSTLPPLKNEPDEEYGLTKENLLKARLEKSAEDAIDDAGLDIQSLIRVYENFILGLKQIRGCYRSEKFCIEDENQEMARRMKDHTGVVYEAVKTLDEAGVLKDIVHDLEKGRGGS